MIAELLRRPGDLARRCHDPIAQHGIARAGLGWIACGGAVFGAAIGSFRSEQLFTTALKIPVVLLAALALTGPGLMALAAAWGRRWTLRSTLALLIAAGARSALVLLALAPVVWLLIDLGLPYDYLRLLATVGFGLAGLSGLGLLVRGLGDAPGRAPAALGFVVLFLIVGAQTAWLMRPYLGDPRDEEVPLFAHGRIEGGVLGALWRSAEGSP